MYLTSVHPCGPGAPHGSTRLVQEDHWLGVSLVSACLFFGSRPGKNPTAVQELATQPSRNHVVTDDAGRARSCFVVGFAKIPPKRELAALGTSLFAPFARAKCCSAGELTGLQQRAARFAQRMLLGGGIEETESFTPVGRAIDPWWRAPFKFGVHRNSLGPPWFTSSKTKLAEVWTGAPFVASCS